MKGSNMLTIYITSRSNNTRRHNIVYTHSYLSMFLDWMKSRSQIMPSRRYWLRCAMRCMSFRILICEVTTKRWRLECKEHRKRIRIRWTIELYRKHVRLIIWRCLLTPKSSSFPAYISARVLFHIFLHSVEAGIRVWAFEISTRMFDSYQTQSKSIHTFVLIDFEDVATEVDAWLDDAASSSSASSNSWLRNNWRIC